MDVKKILSAALLCALLLTGCGRGTDNAPPVEENTEGQVEKEISVAVNGQRLELNAKPYERHGELMIPTEVFTDIGCDIWPKTVEETENDFHSVNIKDVGRLVMMNTDNNTAYLDHYDESGKAVESVEAPLPAEVENGQVYVPAEFACRGMGFGFSWDEATKTADISCTPPEAPFDRRGWNILSELITYACEQSVVFDEDTPLEEIAYSYLFYPGVRDYFFESKGQEVVYSEERSDPRDRFRNFGDHYYYAVVDAGAVDTVLREVFGADDGEMEQLHANDGDFYFQDGKCYIFTGDIGGPYCDVWKYEVTERSGDGSVSVRMWINDLGQSGYCDCKVAPNGEGAEYPFRLLSVDGFVHTGSFEKQP